MIDLIPYLFTLAAMVSVISEIFHPSFSVVWIVPSAAVGIVIILFGLPEWLSVLAFSLSYPVFFFVGRILLRLFYGFVRK
ncbi:MAG: hypothetical protein IKT70_06865 [Clostridia bacterium]|nr:hypothetical protein [Clostridia bacterium]